MCQFWNHYETSCYLYEHSFYTTRQPAAGWTSGWKTCDRRDQFASFQHKGPVVGQVAAEEFLDCRYRCRREVRCVVFSYEHETGRCVFYGRHLGFIAAPGWDSGWPGLNHNQDCELFETRFAGGAVWIDPFVIDSDGCRRQCQQRDDCWQWTYTYGEGCSAFKNNFHETEMHLMSLSGEAYCRSAGCAAGYTVEGTVTETFYNVSFWLCNYLCGERVHCILYSYNWNENICRILADGVFKPDPQSQACRFASEALELSTDQTSLFPGSRAMGLFDLTIRSLQSYDDEPIPDILTPHPRLLGANRKPSELSGVGDRYTVQPTNPPELEYRFDEGSLRRLPAADDPLVPLLAAMTPTDCSKLCDKSASCVTWSHSLYNNACTLHSTIPRKREFGVVFPILDVTTTEEATTTTEETTTATTEESTTTEEATTTEAATTTGITTTSTEEAVTTTTEEATITETATNTTEEAASTTTTTETATSTTEEAASTTTTTEKATSTTEEAASTTITTETATSTIEEAASTTITTETATSTTEEAASTTTTTEEAGIGTRIRAATDLTIANSDTLPLGPNLPVDLRQCTMLDVVPACAVFDTVYAASLDHCYASCSLVKLCEVFSYRADRLLPCSHFACSQRWYYSKGDTTTRLRCVQLIEVSPCALDDVSFEGGDLAQSRTSSLTECWRSCLRLEECM
ncbi:MAG: hypothetical protein KVP17_003025 [Porospora cf. gigantea B]|uniref:uncharacterized protein n=1 Tax=Porospora cf. gigantea B TaxID=2853592 RepID=UPI0035719056|nr:MAG: hypothetical protein KVP17_003025 [Porospora cf. gigantea B]